MSFLPVSEALMRLEFEGLPESRPRADTRVRIPSGEDVRGHYAVREALEVQDRLFAVSAAPEEKAELMRLAVRVDSLSHSPESVRTCPVCPANSSTRACTPRKSNFPVPNVGIDSTG